MVIELAHQRWKKKLLESRDEGKLYQLLGLDEQGLVDIFFKYVDGKWHFKAEMMAPAVVIADVDEATNYIISLGVEEYEVKYGV